MSQNRRPKPKIEIHRVIYTDSGPNRKIIDKKEWERRFHKAWAGKLASVGLQIEIYIWEDFHDRYLISNLIGIFMGNGFDTTNDPYNKTTWTRISRQDKDDIEREFDPAVNKRKLKHSFNIP